MLRMATLLKTDIKILKQFLCIPKEFQEELPVLLKTKLWLTYFLLLKDYYKIISMSNELMSNCTTINSKIASTSHGITRIRSISEISHEPIIQTVDSVKFVI